MSYGYSNDLREKALNYYDSSGKSQSEVSEIFGVSLRTLNSWVQLRRSGDYRRRINQSDKTPHKLDDDVLRASIDANPDGYLHELAEQFGCHASSVMRRCQRLAITRKKNRSISGA